MIYNLYSIRDKYRGFMQPALDLTDEASKREFGSSLNNSPLGMGYAPADFDLYKVGTFDSISGRIDSVAPIEFICNGMEVFNEKP